jgi:nucleoside transporter
MLSRTITFRLCVMMFLEYAVRGMWYPFLANYLSSDRADHGLGFTAGQTGWVLGFAGALGAVTAPILAGRVADRYLNAERALALLHCIAGALLFLNASSTTFSTFLIVMICFSIAYAPTQSLTNSLALFHLTDPEHTYPRTRMWGTVGWIVTSALFTYVVLRAPTRAANIGRIPQAMRAAGAMAIAYAAYAFFLLPKTPPSDASHTPLLPTRALALLKNPSVLVLSLAAIPVATIHTAYYLNIGPFLSDVVHIPLKMVGPTLALAQLSEVGCLFILGPMLKKYGYTTILTFGVAAQALRFMIFAINPPPLVVCIALTLHGIAFACFFTTATLYIERVSSPEIRHSTQTVFGILLFGLGPALAGPYAQMFDRMIIHTATGTMPNFKDIWWTQAAIALFCALFVMLLFRTPKAEPAGFPVISKAELATNAQE